MKTILLITNKESGEVKPYSTLTVFLEENPQYKEKPYPSRFEENLSRKKTAFEDEFFKIERKRIVR